MFSLKYFSLYLFINVLALNTVEFHAKRHYFKYIRQRKTHTHTHEKSEHFSRTAEVGGIILCNKWTKAKRKKVKCCLDTHTHTHTHKYKSS